MDRITKSILKEFQREFDITNYSEQDAFELMTGYLITSIYCKEDIIDLEFMETGFQGGDLSIDSLVILMNGEIVDDIEIANSIIDSSKNNFGGKLSVKFIFAQSKTSASFDGAQILNFLNGVNRFINEDEIENVSEQIQNKVNIKNLIYDNYTKLSENPTVEMYYCTTGRWSDSNGIVPIINPMLKEINNSNLISNSNFTPVDSLDIQKLYKDSKRGIEQTLNIKYKVTLPEVEGIEQAYFGYVPLNEYIKLITNDNGELIKYIFHDNVRDFQGLENKTNKKISETLESQEKSQLFFALNNGVTVISRNLKPHGEKFTLFDYQIVNGCQTSHVLFDFYQRTKDEELNSGLPDIKTINVPIKIIHSENENVISQIVSATNSQTAVTDEDMMARDAYHSILENYYKSEENENIKLYYERRSKQYADFEIEKVRIVTKKQLMRYFGAMFTKMPTEAARFSGSLYPLVGEQIFIDDHKPCVYHFASYVAYRLEYLFRKNRTDNDNGMTAEFKPLRFHILSLIPFFVFNKKPILNGRKTEKTFIEAINLFEDDQQALATFQNSITAIKEFLVSESGSEFSLTDPDLNKKSNFTDGLLAFMNREKGYTGIVDVK